MFGVATMTMTRLVFAAVSTSYLLIAIPLEENCVDVMMASSVMEHVTDPARVYGEIYRVLKPGGHFIFLTANLLDYASIIAKLIPNRFHPWIVSKTE